MQKQFNMKVSTVPILGIFLCAAISAAAAATNYCDPSLCMGTKHIACKNNGAFGALCSSSAQVITITDALKNTILTKHNTLRNQIASGKLPRFKRAERMATMQWNDELARLAVLNVKQCAMVHDECRSTPKFPRAGQNLAYTGWSVFVTISVDQILQEHIQLWFNENKDTTMAQINSFRKSDKMTGHFVQMVLEKATHVGCAVVRQTKDWNQHHYTACNYAFIPFRDYPVYKSTNVAASKCKTGSHSTYKALCSTREVYDLVRP